MPDRGRRERIRAERERHDPPARGEEDEPGRRDQSPRPAQETQAEHVDGDEGGQAEERGDEREHDDPVLATAPTRTTERNTHAHHQWRLRVGKKSKPPKMATLPRIPTISLRMASPRRYALPRISNTAKTSCSAARHQGLVLTTPRRGIPAESSTS